MVEYTPGPWHWTQDEAGQWFLSPGILIAEGSDGTPDGDEHDLANAHLIAAAPDLLEVLDRLERYLRDTPHHNAVEAAAARAVIAKARGEA